LFGSVKDWFDAVGEWEARNPKRVPFTPVSWSNGNLARAAIPIAPPVQAPIRDAAPIHAPIQAPAPAIEVCAPAPICDAAPIQAPVPAIEVCAPVLWRRNRKKGAEEPAKKRRKNSARERLPEAFSGWKEAADRLADEAEEDWQFLQEAAQSGVARKEMLHPVQMRAAANFVPFLLPCMACGLLQVSEESLRKKTPAKAVGMLMEVVCGWSPSTISGLEGAWRRLLVFMMDFMEKTPTTAEDIEGDSVRDFLKYVGDGARDKAAKGKENRQARGKERAQGEIGLRHRNGETAATCVESSLRTIARECRIDLHLDGALIKSLPKANRSDAVEAHPFTIHIVGALEAVAAGSGPWDDLVARGYATPAPSRGERAHASALCMWAFGSSRGEQGQRTDLLARDDVLGVWHGVCNKDKNPVPRAQFARPVWFSTHGLVAGDAFIEPLIESLEGVRDGCFLMRAYEGTGVNERWLQRGCTTAEANASLRSLLHRFCGLTVEQAAAFGVASAREFLPMLAKALGLSPLERLQIGRWAGSFAQDMNPMQRAVGRASLKASVMPDRYAKREQVAFVCRLLREQIEAARAYIQEQGGLSRIPPLQGFEGMRPKVAGAV
jgi:hypothetical protein